MNCDCAGRKARAALAGGETVTRALDSERAHGHLCKSVLRRELSFDDPESVRLKQALNHPRKTNTAQGRALLVVVHSESKMKATRQPQRAFAANRHQRPDKTPAGTTNRGSKDDLEHWRRRHQHYLNLAENAGNADRVDRENYWQHAEHFHRLIAAGADSRRHAGIAAAEPVFAPALIDGIDSTSAKVPAAPIAGSQGVR